MTASRSNAFTLVFVGLAVAGCSSDLNVGSAPPSPSSQATPDAGPPATSNVSSDGGTGEDAAAPPVLVCDGAACVACDGGACGEGWTQTARMTLDDTAAGAEFGASVARVGDDLFVGAPCEEGSGYSGYGLLQCPGGVHTFHKFGTSWVPEQHLAAPGPPVLNAHFGTSLASLGGTLFVGAPGSFTVYEYTRSGDVWQQIGNLEGSQGPEASGFGSNIVAAGDLVAVGWTGGIDLFRQVGGKWTLDVTWKSKAASDPSLGPLFALDGDRLFVADLATPAGDAGLPDDGGDAGFVPCSVQIFDWTPGALTPAQSLDYPDGACGTQGPMPFAVDGPHLVVGHYANKTIGTVAGLDVFDQAADGGAYAFTGTTLDTDDGAEALLGLAGNEAVWVDNNGVQLLDWSGASPESWFQVALPYGYFDFPRPNVVNGFVMTSDELLVGSPDSTNFGQLAGTVESYDVTDAGLILNEQALTGAEALAGNGGIGTLVAAAPGVAVVSGLQTGFYVLEEDAGAWQVGGPLIVPTSGTPYPAVTGQAAVAGGTIALATGDNVYLFQRGANGWTQSAPVLETTLDVFSNLAFDGKTLASVDYDESDGLMKVALIDTTSPNLALTTLPFTDTQCTNYAVSLGGDTLLVAPSMCDHADLSKTETHVYQRTASGWVSAASLYPDTVSGEMNDVYGVVTDGVTAAISVDHFSGALAGAAPTVTFFSQVNGAWQKTQTVEVKTPTAGNLVLDGDFLYTSDPARLEGTAMGTDVVVLQRQAGTWSIATTLGESLGTTFPQGFGTSLALAGHELLVGSPQETVNGKLGWGALYVFDPPANAPVNGPTP